MGQNVPDGNLSFRGGQNAGVLPDRIREDQYASGINVTTVDGGLGPRPGFVFTDIEVLTEGGIDDGLGNIVPYQEILESGKFQGAHPYLSGGFDGIVAVISGIIFAIDPEGCTAEVIPIELQQSSTALVEPESQRIDQYKRRVHIAEAGRFLVIHDFPDTPIIIDGFEARRADPKAVDDQGNPVPEIFASVLGAYNQSRYFFTSLVNEFTAGDPVGSLAAPDAPITVQEIAITAAPFIGQAFSLGSSNQNEPITAIGFLQVDDSSTGIGPLFVANKDSIYAFQTDLPRSQWEQTRFGRKILFNAGIVGPRAFTTVNKDLYFVAADGRIRSLKISASEQNKFANTPIDREVRNWVRTDDPDLLELTSVETVGNRVFITVDPFRVDAQDLRRKPVTDYAFSGMVVLELDNISGMLSDAAPAWAGLWQGILPTQLIKRNDELWIFSKDPNNVNALYRMDESISYDVYKGVERNIASRIYTREYPFQDRFALKEEKFVDPKLCEVEGELTLIVDRKVDAAVNWSRWREWKHNAIVSECGAINTVDRPVLLRHNFRDLNMGDPVDTDCDPISKEDLSYFELAQYRLTIKARHWKLKTFRAMAELQEDGQQIHVCQTYQNKVEKNCEDVSDYLIHSVPFTLEEICL